MALFTTFIIIFWIYFCTGGFVDTEIIFRGMVKLGYLQTGAIQIKYDGLWVEITTVYSGIEFMPPESANKRRLILLNGLNYTAALHLLDKSTPNGFIFYCTTEKDDLKVKNFFPWEVSLERNISADLGWGKWSSWSECSISCSGGIQQRVRYCNKSLCPGHNVEQRHCNLFSCNEVYNLLSTEASFYHPPKNYWTTAKERNKALHFERHSYIWIPNSERRKLFELKYFPTEFSIFLTLRMKNGSQGTIFSVHSTANHENYLSIEIVSRAIKLSHTSFEGADIARIPVDLTDGDWHQVAFSFKDFNVVESYIDCQWNSRYIFKNFALFVTADSIVMIGYSFEGDLEQATIGNNISHTALQCFDETTPITDKTTIKIVN